MSEARTLTYPAIVKFEDGSYLVNIPDWDEVAAGGHTLDDALKEAAGALEEAALCRRDLQGAIPEPSSATQYCETLITITIPAQ